jgi:hypothetical protein
MTPVIIDIPAVPTVKPDSNDPLGAIMIPITKIDIYLWKEKHKKASVKLDKYKEDMACTFIIIFHQCTLSLKSKIEAADNFPTIRAAQDPIALLKLIQSLCCSYNAQTQSVIATVASHKHLFTYYQRDGNDNHKYYQEFCAHVETLETYGRIGAIRITPTFLTVKLKNLAIAGTISSATNPTDPECLLAIKQCCDKFLGCLMLSSANKDRYAALKSDLNNQYGFGKDLYPKSPNQCLSLLNCRSEAHVRSPHHHMPASISIKQEEEALVFAQGSDKKSPSKLKEDGSKSSSFSSSWTSKPQITSIHCKACGKLGHTLSVCPDTKPPPAQIPAMSATVDDASDNSY